MALYRQKPVMVDAVRWKMYEKHPAVLYVGGDFYVNGPAGPQNIKDGDWIVKQPNGYFDVIKDSLFTLLYENGEIYE